MKKSLLLISVLFVLSAKAQTSVYHPFPDSNAVWRVEWQSSVECWPPGTYKSYQYTIGADTSIGIYTYKKIYRSGMTNMCGTPGNYFFEYAGGMRQDSANKKVYFICPGYSDTLLYDFALNVGDTIKTVSCLYGPVGYGNSLHVVTIDSVLIGSNYHKRFNLNDGFSFAEGVGNLLFGVLEPLIFGNNDGWPFVCFSHNTDIYPNTASSCPLISSTNELHIKKDILTISPNPFTSEISITLQNQNIKQATISIKNILGQTVFLKEMKTPRKEIKVDLSFLERGIYLVEVVADPEKNGTGGERMVRKVVKE